MFYIPALGAAASDAIVLLIHHKLSKNDEDSSNDDNGFKLIKCTSYLAITSIIRLFILLPLFSHNVTGSRLKIPILYHIFHFGCLMLIVSHMISILLLDPKSVKTMLPVPSSYYDEPHMMLSNTTNLATMRLIWISLWISLCSISLHWLILYHVRCTAPSRDLDVTSHDKRKQMMAYAAFFQYKKRDVETGKETVDTADSSEEEDEDGSLGLLLPERADAARNRGRANQLSCLGDGYDDFLAELQARMKVARCNWSEKLDEFTTRLHRVAPGGGNTTHLMHYFQHNSPFRVILQLFAYEDVLSNGKLDACFDVDQGEALTFYVPQLLSFLLHGAFLNSIELEKWVLDKCSVNLHFAHCCYWFLRGWCLCAGEHKDDDDDGRGFDRHISESNLKLMKEFSTHEVAGSGDGIYTDEMKEFNGNDKKSPNRQRSHSFEAIAKSHKNSRGNKYPVEERRVIEALLHRVMDCGQTSAQQLQNTAHSNLRSGLHNGNSNGHIALDIPPHLPPLPPLGTEESIHSSTPLPAVARASSSLMGRDTNSSNTRLASFHATPHFLEKLCDIASNLFYTPREKRTNSLRHELQQLNAKLSPSDTIYIPIRNVNHRVYNIVADESIAISTKERVPCIICVEVIDHSKSRRKDAELLENWVKGDRFPQRHEGILEKVQHYTHRGLKKLREHEGDLKEIFEKMMDDEDSNGVVPDSLINSKKTNNITPQHRHLHNNDNATPASAIPEIQEDEQRSPTPVNACQSAHRHAHTCPSTPPPPRSPSPIANMGQWSSTPNNTPSKPKQPFKSTPISTSDDKSSPIEQTQPSPSLPQLYLMPNIEAPAVSPTPTSLSRPQPSPSPLTDQSLHYGTTIPNPPNPPRPTPVIFKESWLSKTSRLRSQSPIGSHPSYRLLPILIKSNDDLRQEQLASQLIQQMAMILAKAKIPVWLYPYEILALTESSGIIEAIPDTISLDSLKKNDENFSSLATFFTTHFGPVQSDVYSNAKANFVESLAAYSIVTYLLQIKDRHNGNILLDNQGHLIHIDFGFFFLSSPGKNSGFESAPFKLTREFVEMMDGPTSRTFKKFRSLCLRTFLELRKHCYQITLLVEMLMQGNEDLPCFRGKPEEAVRGLKDRFKLDWSDRACVEYVNQLIDESLENWRTRWYDTYQRLCVGVF